jgi:hypothetical protein
VQALWCKARSPAVNHRLLLVLISAFRLVRVVREECGQASVLQPSVRCIFQGRLLKHPSLSGQSSRF